MDGNGYQFYYFTNWMVTCQCKIANMQKFGIASPVNPSNISGYGSDIVEV